MRRVIGASGNHHAARSGGRSMVAYAPSGMRGFDSRGALNYRDGWLMRTEVITALRPEEHTAMHHVKSTRIFGEKIALPGTIITDEGEVIYAPSYEIARQKIDPREMGDLLSEASIGKQFLEKGDWIGVQFLGPVQPVIEPSAKPSRLLGAWKRLRERLPT